MNRATRRQGGGRGAAALLGAGWLLVAASVVVAVDEGADAEQGKELTHALEQLETLLAEAPNHLRHGADYRQTVIQAGEHDRGIAFFEALVVDHPEASNAWLNFAYAYVDKIPSEGAITQVLLANTALGHFSRALELEETWLGLYSRGNSYLYWPAIFGRTPKAIADLERAIEVSEAVEAKPYHARAWAALGEAYWRLDDKDKAREIWGLGLERFPKDEGLVARHSRQGEELDALLEAHFEPSRRVDTDLLEIFEAEEGS